LFHSNLALLARRSRGKTSNTIRTIKEKAMTAGPLSMPCQDIEKYKALDTAEKRDEALKHGGYETGKTAKSRRKGAPVSMEKAPKNLAKRIKAFEALKDTDRNSGAYHRPGSNKK
jgi:hypothetical protein